jgi:type III secretion system YopN/LcrE/InvE/MxiC family regulator
MSIQEAQAIQDTAARHQTQLRKKQQFIGSFKGIHVLPKSENKSSFLLNALEEIGASHSERRHTELAKRKVQARRENLIKYKEEMQDIVKKVPTLNKSGKLDTLVKEILSHTDLTHDVILRRLDAQYKDVSFKYLALGHIEHKLEKALQRAVSENNSRVIIKLTNALHHVRRASNYLLRSSKKRDILAGINIAEISDQFESNLGLDDAENLIGFYRDSVLDYKTLSVAYGKILEKYGVERFFVGIDYLLQALGSDMGAKGSSISLLN